MDNNEQNELFSLSTNLWLIVKRDIETKIITGEYEAGKKIPTIVELVEQYHIGKTTAQKVINALNDEGTIIKKVGIGCFVKPFVKEKLLAQHKKEIEKKIENFVIESLFLGISKEYVTQLIDKVWNSETMKEKNLSV